MYMIYTEHNTHTHIHKFKEKKQVDLKHLVEEIKYLGAIEWIKFKCLHKLIFQ